MVSPIIVSRGKEPGTLSDLTDTSQQAWCVDCHPILLED
jgi:hypothetical protein